MTTNSNVHRGVIYGKTIELDDDTGLPDGQEVTITVQPVTADQNKLPPGEGLRRSFGAWADEQILHEYDDLTPKTFTRVLLAPMRDERG